MLDTKQLSDEKLRELFAEPLSEEEANAMREADEVAMPFLALSLQQDKSSD